MNEENQVAPSASPTEEIVPVAPIETEVPIQYDDRGNVLGSEANNKYLDELTDKYMETNYLPNNPYASVQAIKEEDTRSEESVHKELTD